ncbi:MAG: hypothetical protein IJM53_06750 [Lachnospiraceae bacterium]|nr:hypothetical protein [Lachnospiraceae bacterium]
MKNEKSKEFEEDNSLNNKVSVYRFSPVDDFYYEKYGPSDNDYYVAAVDGELSMLKYLPQGVYRLIRLK